MEGLRRTVGRKRTSGLPKELSRVNLNAAGIDVGASSHFVAVSEASAEECVREFEAYTSELYRMADWLVECGVETVAMESTGVYWIGFARKVLIHTKSPIPTRKVKLLGESPFGRRPEGGT